MAGELNPEQLADLAIRRRQIRLRHDLGQAQQNYLSGAATRESGRGLEDIVTQYGRMRERLPFAYARRGLLNSGIYAKALADRVGDFGRTVTHHQARLSDTLGGYELARQQLGQVQGEGLKDIDELEAARISSVAAMLRASGA